MALLATTVNVLSAALALAAILFYVVVYTMVLKRRTPQNIVWGGAAGCMPVLIGWSAVTGRLSWAAVVLFGVIFLWTPPHYWPLSLKFRDDYSRAGVPMLPVVAPAAEVSRKIVVYAWATVLWSLLLVPLGGAGPVYAVTALVAGGWLVAEAHLLLRRARAGAAEARADAALPPVDHVPDRAVRRGRPRSVPALLMQPGHAGDDHRNPVVAGPGVAAVRGGPRRDHAGSDGASHGVPVTATTTAGHRDRQQARAEHVRRRRARPAAIVKYCT